MKIKLKQFAVSHFIYDQHNQRLIVYKNDGSLPRVIKCDQCDASNIANNYISAVKRHVDFSIVPIIFNVKKGI